jgi:hypothetical protein
MSNKSSVNGELERKKSQVLKKQSEKLISQSLELKQVYSVLRQDWAKLKNFLNR